MHHEQARAADVVAITTACRALGALVCEININGVLYDSLSTGVVAKSDAHPPKWHLTAAAAPPTAAAVAASRLAFRRADHARLLFIDMSSPLVSAQTFRHLCASVPMNCVLLPKHATSQELLAQVTQTLPVDGKEAKIMPACDNVGYGIVRYLAQMFEARRQLLEFRRQADPRNRDIKDDSTRLDILVLTSDKSITADDLNAHFQEHSNKSFVLLNTLADVHQTLLWLG
jgi:hypothetical protein